MDILIPKNATPSKFGQDVEVARSESLSTTTLQTWEDKLEIPAPTIPGEYNLSGYIEAGVNNVDGKACIRIIESVSENVIISAKRNSPATDNEIVISGSIPLTVDGTETSYKLQFCRAGVLSTVGVRRARLQLWRMK